MTNVENRHDQDMARSSTSEKNGGGRGESNRTKKPAAPRWSFPRERLTKSASASYAVSMPYPERTAVASPEQHSSKIRSNGSSSRGENIRSDSPGKPQSRATAGNVLRRTNSEASTGSVATIDGLSVAASNDPEILKSEIRRLQGALMNEFKGGNRFIGGAQFKASVRKQTGNCGECLKVREALRRCRVESRDLRGSLFRAEAVIKQLTLTKATRRAQNKALFVKVCGGASEMTAGDNETTPDAYSLCAADNTGSGKGKHMGVDKPETCSREGLLTRVRQLERELCLAEFRHSHGIETAVGVDHGLRQNQPDVSTA